MANKVLSALRGVLGVAFNLGQMLAEDYQWAVKVKSIRGETLLAGRSITSGEIAALLDVCINDQSPGGTRDAAIIALLYSCGLRWAELGQNKQCTNDLLARETCHAERTRSISFLTCGNEILRSLRSLSMTF
jgi:site-specific recombinase XerC